MSYMKLTHLGLEASIYRMDTGKLKLKKITSLYLSLGFQKNIPIIKFQIRNILSVIKFISKIIMALISISNQLSKFNYFLKISRYIYQFRFLSPFNSIPYILILNISMQTKINFYKKKLFTFLTVWIQKNLFGNNKTLLLIINLSYNL